jgi:hypothetical protein
MLGTRRLTNVMTVRKGEVVYEGSRPKSRGAAPAYDIVIKHANGDIAITGDKIVRAEHGIAASRARILIAADGYSVEGGLTAPVTAKNKQFYAYSRGITTIAASGPPVPAKLAAGSPADVAIWSGNRCALTIHKGKVVWDTDGLSVPDWELAGPYSNFK